MDLEEWELLPDDGFLEIHDDGGKKIFSRKYGGDPNSVFQMNYFICPSPKSQKIAFPSEKPRLPNQLVPVPIQLEPSIGQALQHERVKEVTKAPVDLSVVPSVIIEKIKAPNIGAEEAADQDTVSQVFFKKMKENEFVDMKMDSPRSSTGRGIVPQIDAGTFQFEDRSEGSKMKTEKETVTKKNSLDSDTKGGEVTWEEKNDGLNIWKWGLTGIGAICSFGVAAASICIIIIGSHQKNKQQNQKLRFQIYTDDKRIYHPTKVE